MAITRYLPRTVHLGGDITLVNDVSAGGAITPGMLIERYQISAGVVGLRAHATAGGNTVPLVALNTPMLNKGVDDAYATGDLVEAAVGQPGATFWMLIGSGVNAVAGAKLESAGNGLLRLLAAGTPLFTALVDTNNTAGPGSMRIKVEAL
jgi:hypothetical protein